jgi:hypothetical protein
MGFLAGIVHFSAQDVAKTESFHTENPAVFGAEMRRTCTSVRRDPET